MLSITHNCFPDSEIRIFTVEDNAVIGWIDVSQWGQESILIERVFVEPAHRSRGIDRLMLNEFLELVDKDCQGVQEIIVTERATNPSRLELYRALGFCDEWKEDGLVGLRLEAMNM